MWACQDHLQRNLLDVCLSQRPLALATAETRAAAAQVYLADIGELHARSLNREQDGLFRPEADARTNLTSAECVVRRKGTKLPKRR